MTAGAVSFACDAMLGGLARWLRAAGYDAAWRSGVGDWDLIRLARREGRVLLSADHGIFLVGEVRDGDVPSLFIPPGLRTHQQLALVLQRLELPLREPRCMACGGGLVEIAKDRVRDRVPPRTWHWLEQFYECTSCGKILWRGSHWPRIIGRLQHAMAYEEC